MMAGQPHDKSGRKCSEPDCGTEFTKNSYFGSVIEKVDGFIVQRIVCRECHNRILSQGE